MTYILQPGDQLRHYQITDVLGSGGFGVTYRATDLAANREVAIKEYFPQIAMRDSGSRIVKANSYHTQKEFDIGLKRFRIESGMLAKFSHINIVAVLDVFDENNTAYMVMEYVHGRDLFQHMNKLQRSLSYKEILDVFIPVLDGLRSMHKENVLHLDLKPENIFVRDEGPPCLIDFGGARHYAAQESRLVVADGAKVSFMVAADGFSPPEQYSEEKITKGPWSDIYALGATIYSCMNNGQTPPSSLMRFGQFMNDEDDPLHPAIKRFKGKYPEDLLELIDRCLSPNRKHRPQNAQEMQDYLIKIANSEKIEWKKRTVSKKPAQINENDVPPPVNPSRKQPSPQLREPKGALAFGNGAFIEPSNNIGSSNFTYAGFWLRVAAILIDGVILVGIFFAIAFFIGVYAGAVGADVDDWFSNDRYTWIDFLYLVLQWLYFAGLESSSAGGTYGKRILKIKVVNLQGKPISFWHATGRFAGKFISGITLMIGYLMAGFTRKKQALHDMMASTLVIKK